MTTVGERRGGQPIVCHPDGQSIQLSRIPLTERRVVEGWLQDLIERHPEALPVQQIEPAFAPVVSIGKEVPTAVGRIDNLYVSPEGFITIVETKLWRNPEARRQVVGQIIEYAAALSRWSYQELNDYVRSYNRRFRGEELDLFETLRQEYGIPADDEPRLVDRISLNLRQGRLLLLIAGDGIRKDVEEIAEFLQVPQLHFTLALLELQLYSVDSNGEDSILVMPQIVARTRELVRAVVRVEGQDISAIQIGPEVVQTRDSTSKSLTRDDFLQILSEHVNAESVQLVQRMLTDAPRLGCSVEFARSVKFKLVDPGGSGRLTIFFVDKQGEVHIGYLFRQLEKRGLPTDSVAEYVTRLGELLQTRLPEPHGGTWWAKIGCLNDLLPVYEPFLEIVEQTVERIRDQLTAD